MKKQNNYQIITRRSSECKFIIFNFFGGITLKDLLIFTFSFFIGIFIFFILLNFSLILSLIIFIFYMLFSMILFLPIKNENIKFYQYIYLAINHLISKKQLKSIYTNELTKLKDIDDDLIIFKNNIYGKILELNGDAINDNNYSEIYTKINSLYNVFNKLNNIEFDIIKIDLPVNVNKQTKHINDLIKKNKNDLNKNINIQLKNFKNNLKNLNHYSSILKPRFFIFLYNKSKEELNYLYNSLINNHLSYINFNKIENDLLNYISNYFSFNNFKKLTININKKYIKKQNYYFSIKGISKYPFYVSEKWGNEIFSIPNIDVVLKKCSLSKQEAIQRIDKTILKAEALESNKESKNIEKNEFLEHFISLQNDVKRNDENINLIEIYFVICASSIKELNLVEKKLKEVLDNNNFRIKNYYYVQKNILWNLLGVNYKKMKNGQEISNKALSLFWPFHKKTIADSKGLLLGNNIETNESAFFDICYRDKNRTNSNCIVFGKTGSGKTFNVLKQINWNILNDIKTFIIDPEREYNNIAKYYNGKIIKLSDYKNSINPLQILTGNILEQIILFEEILKILFGTLNINDSYLLSKILRKVYDKFLIFENSDFSKIKKWPTIVDVFDLFKNDNDFNKSNLKIYLWKMINLNRWNNKTSIDLNNKIIVFDIHDLSISTEIKNVELFLLINFLDNELKKNKLFNEKYSLNNWINIVIDEAHLLMNKNNLITLNYISQLTKRIRKYNGILILITQNISDLLADKTIELQTSAIINNMQYMFIHHLSTKDVNDLNNIFKINRKLTNFQKEFIFNSKQGECIFIINGNDYQYLKILDYSKIEEEAWK